MKVIACYNLKGGVGKTCVIWALAHLYTQQGLKVLSIDLDSQRNLTYSYGVLAEAAERNILFGLLDNALKNNIVKTEHWGDIIPGHESLDSLGLNARSEKQEYLLKEALSKLSKKSYDIVLIDCPPGLGLTNVNALCSCDYLITPSNLEPYSIQGLYSLNNAIQQAKGKNKSLKWLGVLLTDYKPRLTLVKALEEQLSDIAKELGVYVLCSPIRYSVKVKEAITQGEPLPKCSSYDDYLALSLEIKGLIKL